MTTSPPHKLMTSSLTRVAFGLSVPVLCLYGAEAHAQFNLPLPAPPSGAVVLQDDVQMLFVDWSDRATYTRSWADRVKKVRERAVVAENGGTTAEALSSEAKAFCAQEPSIPREACEAALQPKAILTRFGREAGREALPGEVYIRWSAPLFGTRRPKVARYLRFSGGKEGLSIIPQFTANISDDEAYVVSSLVRGVVGRGIFSADQALVVARSGDPDPSKRESIESDKANAIRAINNGGTLVARYTMPMYAATSSTAARAFGLTVGTGVIGSISDAGDGEQGASRRNAVASAAFEGLISFPVRGLTGTSEVVADLMVGGRLGYTRSGGPLRVADDERGVGYGQLVVGLRQNSSLSASALVTFANNGFNSLVPRIGINLAAQR